MEEIRSFIAIELPDEILQGLSRLVSRLKLLQPDGVKWVDPSGIHLTLKFLGNVAPGRISEITEAMAESARGISPFSLEIKELGVFPNLDRVRVVWVGIEGETDELSQLQRRLESNLAILGFPPEERDFTPHLTLARVREQASPVERQGLGQLIAATKLKPIGPFTVAAIALIRSQLTRAGAVYSRIGAVDLRGLV